MNKVAVVQEGRVVGLAVGQAKGIAVSEAIATLPTERLALVAGDVVDASTLSIFWVDAAGRKHGDAGEPAWQEVVCAYDEVLVLEDGNWRTKLLAEVLQEARDEAYGRVKKRLYEFITSEDGADFPTWKQADFAARGGELAAMSVGGAIEAGSDEEAELAQLREVRVWVDGLKTERERVKELIYAAGNDGQLAAAEAGLVLAPPPFEL